MKMTDVEKTGHVAEKFLIRYLRERATVVIS
jgi:hypothetical protein